METRHSLLIKWINKFRVAKVDSPELSAELLLMHVLKINRLELILSRYETLSASDEEEFITLARRREVGEPVAYLLGRREFYGLDFAVSNSVLIPRPETEWIVDYALEHYRATSGVLNILDVGTGCGTIAVTLACALPRAQIFACDISFEAIRVAKANAQAHNVAKKISFCCCDLIASLRLGTFDLILANLPYVPLRDRAKVDKEVLEHEPHIALFAGVDGLAVYRRLADMLAHDGSPGCLVCECDASHAHELAALFDVFGWSVNVHQDFAGRDRYVSVVF